MNRLIVPRLEHGGPDAGPLPRHDFSTNANPLPPPAPVRAALHQADRQRYPDPAYTALRTRLAEGHGIDPEQVLPSAGNGEAIRRLTLAASLHGRRQVWCPEPGYADYRAAAGALGLPVRAYAGLGALAEALQRDPTPALVWVTEPHSPSGRSSPTVAWQALADGLGRHGAWLAIDRAYEPLRLLGHDPVPAAIAERAWQLHTPNKALGLPGVRAGWLQAPATATRHLLAMVDGLAASWVLSAEGVALLTAYQDPAVQAWLADSRATLRDWGQAQRALLEGLGWTLPESDCPFGLARPDGPSAALPARLARLREAGIKLRDARSFGLPGWVRLSTQAPEAQAALVAAWRSRPGQTAPAISDHPAR